MRLSSLEIATNYIINLLQKRIFDKDCIERYNLIKIKQGDTKILKEFLDSFSRLYKEDKKMYELFTNAKKELEEVERCKS